MKYGELPERDRSVRQVDTGNGIATVYGVPMFLYCQSCDLRFSATRGDYFMADPEETITCSNCGEDMILAQEQTAIVEVGT